MTMDSGVGIHLNPMPRPLRLDMTWTLAPLEPHFRPFNPFLLHSSHTGFLLVPVHWTWQAQDLHKISPLPPLYPAGSSAPFSNSSIAPPMRSFPRPLPIPWPLLFSITTITIWSYLMYLFVFSPPPLGKQKLHEDREPLCVAPHWTSSAEISLARGMHLHVWLSGWVLIWKQQPSSSRCSV